MTVNVDKNKHMNIYFGRSSLQLEPIKSNGTATEEVCVFKLLGLMINNNLDLSDHVNYICSKASMCIYFLVLLKHAGKPSSDIVDTYISII